MAFQFVSFSSLMKIRILDDSLLPRCVLTAILKGHYHIANHIVCDNYDKVFHLFFPDGRVSASFFAALLDSELIRQGEQIAMELLRWLSKLDIQRLTRELERDETIPRLIIRRFKTMHSEMSEQRDYPYDAE